VGRPKGADLENSSRRRKQLMDAAVASIAEHGLSSTTLATVAKASGLSQGTLIFYFKTKEMLLAEAFQHRMEEYQQATRDAINEAGDDPVDRIIGATFAALGPEILSFNNLALWNEFWPEAARSQGLKTVFERIEAERQAMMRAIFEDARELLSGSAWTPEIAARAVETMIEGIWGRLYYSAAHISFKDAVQIMSLLLCTILPAHTEAIMKRANALTWPEQKTKA
jgi:TetR/AcrR family transcriptional regulator, transcriptional repressor of bet genes